MQKVSAAINVIILVFIGLIAFKNSNSVGVDFVFANVTMPLFVLLIITFLVGMVFGRTLFSMFTKKNK